MNTKHARTQWLKQAKTITNLTVERNSLIHQSCPDYPDDEDRKENLKAIAKASKAIDKTIDGLAAIEKDNPAIGAVTILGTPVSPAIHHALVLLVSSRLCSDADREFRLVADLMDSVACRNPDTAVEVRSAFRHDGQLAPLVALRTQGDGLDLGRPVLRESAFNKILGLPEDVEFLRFRSCSGKGEAPTHPWF